MDIRDLSSFKKEVLGKFMHVRYKGLVCLERSSNGGVGGNPK